MCCFSYTKSKKNDRLAREQAENIKYELKSYSVNKRHMVNLESLVHPRY